MVNGHQAPGLAVDVIPRQRSGEVCRPKFRHDQVVPLHLASAKAGHELRHCLNLLINDLIGHYSSLVVELLRGCGATVGLSHHAAVCIAVAQPLFSDESDNTDEWRSRKVYRHCSWRFLCRSVLGPGLESFVMSLVFTRFCCIANAGEQSTTNSTD